MHADRAGKPSNNLNLNAKVILVQYYKETIYKLDE
jgi:hypothetical protein